MAEPEEKEVERNSAKAIQREIQISYRLSNFNSAFLQFTANSIFTQLSVSASSLGTTESLRLELGKIVRITRYW